MELSSDLVVVKSTGVANELLHSRLGKPVDDVASEIPKMNMPMLTSVPLSPAGPLVSLRPHPSFA